MDDAKYEALLSRFAVMEAEVSGYRSRKQEPAGLDPTAFKGQFTSDPLGTISRMGLPLDHITRVLVAHAMGDAAPPELKALAAMGPQVSATATLDAKVTELTRQLTEMTASSSRNGVRTSFNALATDKVKYPNLSKALTAQPDLYNEELATRRGSADEIAAQLEAHLTKVAAIYAPQPASDEAAVSTPDPSTQIKPVAAAGALVGGVPPLPTVTQGVFTQDEHTKLRDEIVRKYTPSK